MLHQRQDDERRQRFCVLVYPILFPLIGIEFSNKPYEPPDHIQHSNITPASEKLQEATTGPTRKRAGPRPLQVPVEGGSHTSVSAFVRKLTPPPSHGPQSRPHLAAPCRKQPPPLHCLQVGPPPLKKNLTVAQYRHDAQPWGLPDYGGLFIAMNRLLRSPCLSSPAPRNFIVLPANRKSQNHSSYQRKSHVSIYLVRSSQTETSRSGSMSNFLHSSNMPRPGATLSPTCLPCSRFVSLNPHPFSKSLGLVSSRLVGFRLAAKRVNLPYLSGQRQFNVSKASPSWESLGSSWTPSWAGSGQDSPINGPRTLEKAQARLHKQEVQSGPCCRPASERQPPPPPVPSHPIPSCRPSYDGLDEDDHWSMILFPAAPNVRRSPGSSLQMSSLFCAEIHHGIAFSHAGQIDNPPVELREPHPNQPYEPTTSTINDHHHHYPRPNLRKPAHPKKPHKKEEQRTPTVTVWASQKGAAAASDSGNPSDETHLGPLGPSWIVDSREYAVLLRRIRRQKKKVPDRSGPPWQGPQHIRPPGRHTAGPRPRPSTIPSHTTIPKLPACKLQTARLSRTRTRMDRGGPAPLRSGVNLSLGSVSGQEFSVLVPRRGSSTLYTQVRVSRAAAVTKSMTSRNFSTRPCSFSITFKKSFLKYLFKFAFNHLRFRNANHDTPPTPITKSLFSRSDSCHRFRPIRPTHADTQLATCPFLGHHQSLFLRGIFVVGQSPSIQRRQ
ncbi:uncharacterized protein CLUP02_06438 [Colletotrichum lupini]|uniref:Uncharacterized protein n=1 Tax=Colletotrichum lupini TaxID=145971 RepID=A0A9Q8SP48_9PEZI|nr:uncharacterized protein CLUP02_06438 [Colletotrichum lupini]UQC80952.1 hypothetical protein CLUP02_06438 [Colletotrichum lupini]